MKHSMTYKMFLLVMSGLSLMLLLNPTALAQKGQEKAEVSPWSLVKEQGTSDKGQGTNDQTAFTYQGQLKDANGPVNGSFDFQFVLYSAQTGGEQLGMSEMKDMDLTNGMFSFKLDFGRAAVETKESWLEIGVRPSGSSEAYMVLFPRQKLTPTPYAIFAQHEQWSLIGVPVGFADSGDKAAVTTDDMADHTETKNAGEEAAKSSGLAKEKAADAENKTAAAPQGTAGTIAKFLDTTTLGDSVIRESNGRVLIGGAAPPTPTDVPLLRLTGNARTDNIAVTFNNIGADGKAWRVGTGFHGGDTVGKFFISELQAGAGPFEIVNRLTIDNGTGNVGIGTTTPTSKLDVVSGSGDIFHLTGYEPFLTFFDTNHGNRRGAIQAVNGDLNQFADSYLTGANPFAFIQLNNSGNVGIGVANPLTKLHVVGNRIRIENAGKRLDLRADGAAVDLHSETTNLFIRSSGPNGNNQVLINAGPEDGNVGIGTIYPQAKLDVAGMTRTGILQITGGGDLAEPFEITDAESIQPGMVVAIDPGQPRHLRIADTAYDRTVAGIISGANGINPGLTMKQEGTAADGNHPVALTGRVYCWADASYGPIEPGDLLTTSDTPGHAMKVTDHTQAQGAIIGKAMTSLKDGKGLVLVLVTLQ